MILSVDLTTHLLLWSIFVDSYLGRGVVGVDQIFKDRLLVVHRASKPLVVRSCLRFQANHIKGQVLGRDNTLDQVCEIVLPSARE